MPANLKGVAPERTQWRCPDISQRHRMWGFDLPATDIDFLLVECKYRGAKGARPAMLVEYKRHGAPWNPDHLPSWNRNRSSFLALKSLADNYKYGPIPFIVALYHTPEWWFRIIPLNDAARNFYQDKQTMTEQEFVRSLYRIRNLEPDETVIGGLFNLLPPTKAQRDSAKTAFWPRKNFALRS